ncbi:hypothetical protein, partial [Lusitaniella coriacea]|uniref:hypothetical protein n=1 Tax=Lusitaniella coriacea TaxID=1983105 RepID=UPI001D153B40
SPRLPIPARSACVLSARHSEVPYRTAEMPEKVPASRPPDCAIALQEEVATSEVSSDACDQPRNLRGVPTSVLTKAIPTDFRSHPHPIDAKLPTILGKLGVGLC